MTYQKSTQHYDDNADADESSSLFLTVATASPSFSLGHDGEATTKKNGVPVRAMIATCIFLLGTLAVLYSGGSGSSNRTAGTSEALLLGHTQAAPALYDPFQDFCFADKDNPGKYCWHDSRFMGGCGSCWPFPMEQWEIDPNPHGNNNCGQLCDQFAPANVGW